jgi:hypothetical protein
MGSNQSKKNYVESDIQNEMNTMIHNSTKNICNIINETTTSVTNDIITHNVSSVSVNAGGGNAFTAGFVNLTGNNNHITIEQTNDERLRMEACQQLINNASAMSELASQVSTQFNTKLQTNSAAQDSLDVLAKCQTVQTEQGGIKGAVNAVANGWANIWPTMTGANTSTDSRTISHVLTKVGIDISNIIENENNIKNKINNQITTGVTTTNNTNCDITGFGSNSINIAGFNVSGTNNTFELTQSTVITSFVTCIQNNINTVELASSLATDAGSTNATDNQVTTSVQNSISAQADTSRTVNLAGDQGMFGGMAGCGTSCSSCCCCIIIIAIVGMTMLK